MFIHTHIRSTIYLHAFPGKCLKPTVFCTSVGFKKHLNPLCSGWQHPREVTSWYFLRALNTKAYLVCVGVIGYNLPEGRD